MPPARLSKLASMVVEWIRRGEHLIRQAFGLPPSPRGEGAELALPPYRHKSAAWRATDGRPYGGRTMMVRSCFSTFPLEGKVPS